MTLRITRRGFAALAGGLLVSTRTVVAQTETPPLTRAIPHSASAFPPSVWAPPRCSTATMRRRAAKPMPWCRRCSKAAGG
ncbi:MAG: hypothetical protein LBH31_05015, partial [Burkholderiaceae bacterium]|nr:hypothetical protein [Burkholderiaceae bacterium]